MGKRRYDQFCALARALDVLGERWTLLVVRELLLGPRRYTDLLAALPGIGTNLLAARLRALEKEGVVARRALPPPAPATVYELTESGRELEPAVIELVRWGGKRLGRPEPGEHFRPAWLGIVMQAAFRPEAAAGLRETYEFRIDDEVLHVQVDDGAARVRQGPAAEPELSVNTSAPVFARVISGELTLLDAVEQGVASVAGDRAALERCVEVFGPTPLHAAR
jgi:DNA-binding HxlR family transcriptional regulator